MQQVNILIYLGANVNAKNEQNQTLLHAATVKGCYMFLFKKKKNKKKRFIHVGNFEIVKLLIEFGAYVNATNVKKETALHWAAYYGNILI